eukprot:7398665-Pyramimonas_sp.AAC.1
MALDIQLAGSSRVLVFLSNPSANVWASDPLREVRSTLCCLVLPAASLSLCAASTVRIKASRVPPLLNTCAAHLPLSL